MISAMPINFPFLIDWLVGKDNYYFSNDRELLSFDDREEFLKRANHVGHKFFLNNLNIEITHKRI